MIQNEDPNIKYTVKESTFHRKRYKVPNKRVCVVGAGIAGLVTAKVLKADGFEVVVFEKEPTIGGVWTPSRTYPGLRTNGPRETYAFSDFPYPETADDFPTAAQVRNYLGSYADHFELRNLIRLSTEVVSISRKPENSSNSHPGFQVDVKQTNGSDSETLHFDYVVICNGVFSKPYLPHIEGEEQFPGQILHSSELKDTALDERKRVVVVGAGKSALDCATMAAKRAKSSTIVFRKPYWMIPRYFFGKIRMDKLLMTRFSEIFLRYHRPNRVESFLHSTGKPFVRLFWKAQSWLITRLFKIPPALVPKQPLPNGFESGGVGGEFYDALRQERLIPKRAQITRYNESSEVELDTGERIKADMVIFASGWRQDVSFLDADLRNSIQKDGNFHLYRFILPPNELHLGFVGYASSIASPLTSEIAAHWLSHHFLGKLKLPSKEEMEREIEQVLQWSSEIFPGRKEGYFIGPYVAHYVDELMHDMGLKTYRDNNVLAEYFLRFMPSRYREVSKERQQIYEEVG